MGGLGSFSSTTLVHEHWYSALVQVRTPYVSMLGRSGNNCLCLRTSLSSRFAGMGRGGRRQIIVERGMEKGRDGSKYEYNVKAASI